MIYPDLHEKGDISDIVEIIGEDETVKRLNGAVENTPVLNTGNYTVNNNGVFLDGSCVIPQTLLITKRFEDIETGFVKLELSIREKEGWKRIITDRAITADRIKIISLASQGMLITSETAAKVVQYLHTLEVLNDIATQKTVSHMGYTTPYMAVDNFIPYADDIVYNGEPSYLSIYKAVKSKGKLETWVNMYKDCRNDNIAVRVSVASSFASVLLHQFGKLPFIVHSWGNSDTGKTMILRLACSVWGYHEDYMRNLNNTYVGMERLAYFYHNLPLALDELQTVRKDINIGSMIYLLTQGQGRTRGNLKGVETVLQWKCAIITNGEQPLTNSNSNTGEINRIIDIPVTGQILKNPSHVYTVCDENYGHAGRYFIEHLNKYKPHETLSKWETLLNQHNGNISGKHRMSLSVILTADELVNRILFGMNDVEAHTDTMEFYMKLSSIMISTAESDIASRAYDYICNWIVEHNKNFHSMGNEAKPLEYWGDYSAGKTSVFIFSNALKEALVKAHFNYESVLKALGDKNFIIRADKSKENTKQLRVDGVRIRGTELILPS